MISDQKVVAFDVQGFIVKNKFIPKEVAILDYEWKSTHLIMKPPSDHLSLNSLPERDRRQIKWLTRNYHGIKWIDGFVDYSQMESIIKPILSKYDTIYVCGNQKEKFLETLGLSNKVIDMRIIGDDLPRLSDMIENENHRCIHHQKSIKNMCALKNAYNIAYYLIK